MLLDFTVMHVPIPGSSTSSQQHKHCLRYFASSLTSLQRKSCQFLATVLPPRYTQSHIPFSRGAVQGRYDLLHRLIKAGPAGGRKRPSSAADPGARAARIDKRQARRTSPPLAGIIYLDFTAPATEFRTASWMPRSRARTTGRRPTSPMTAAVAHSACRPSPARGSTLSASDVIPLRLDQPPGAPSEEELREAVIKHVHSEAKLYPDAPEGDCHPIQPRMHQAPDRW